MRTLASVVLVAALATGCGSKSKPVDTTPANTPAASETAAADPAPAPDADPAAPAGGGVLMTDAEVEVATQKAIVMLEALASAVETNADDCPKMAVAIEKVIGEHQAFIDEAKKWQGNSSNDERMQAGIQPTMDKITPKLMGGMAKCGSDPAVQAAFGKLE